MAEEEKKDLQEDLDNLNHVITHLDPDILDMKSSVPQEASLPTKIGWWNSSWTIWIPKRWCRESAICQQNRKTQQWPQDWKRTVFIPIPKKGNVKDCSNYCTIALISHASKIMLKILQARLQQYVNRELPYVQAGFRKGRGTRDHIANIHWIIEKAREFQKNMYFCFIDYAKAFDCVDHNKLWKILQEMGMPDHLTCLLRNLYAGQKATVRTENGTIH